ncbi:MAG: tetratricopeptide repeat protein [Myxococcales bacterium]|nr:tetratricopeptide repeat protein [Myxococcales bacterium]
MKSLSIAALALFALALFACKTAPEVVKPDPALAAAPPPPPKERTPEELFSQGVKAFDAGKLEDAEAAFQKVLEKAPQMVNAQYNLGVVKERLGNLAEAEAAYEATRKLDPNHTPTLLNLGKVYRLRDKFEKAISLYEQALKQPGREHDVALLNNLTVAYRLGKRFKDAEATVRKVLSRTKDNPDAYKNLALIYYDQGNFRLAEFISGNARKLDDKDPGVHNNLGMIHLKLEDRRRALGEFQKAVTLNDKFAPGHMNIGAMALSYRDYEGAEKAFGKAVALDPTSYEGHLGFAFALDGQKGRDPKKGLAAGAAFEKVLAIRADHPDAICGAGWAYAADRSGWDKALTLLEKCKGLLTTSAQDQQLVDNKMKGILAMQKTGAQQGAPPQERQKPKEVKGGESLLDKVADQAAKEEGAQPPPEGQPQPPPAGAQPQGEAPKSEPAPAPTEAKQ